MPDHIDEIHPDGSVDVRVARQGEGASWLRGRPLGHVVSTRARCGHCSVCASGRMLRRQTSTAERTVTLDGDKVASKKQLTKEGRLENGTFCPLPQQL